MELYYRVEKESKTGKAFMEIQARKKKFDDKAQSVMDKYGIRCMYRIGWDLCGVQTCKFNTPPDKTDWKRVDDGYMPKVRSKNKELLDDFKELKALSIKRSEIDNLLGHGEPFHQVGYEIFDDCIIFISDDKHPKKCPDAKPISNTAYLRMQKEKEKSK